MRGFGFPNGRSNLGHVAAVVRGSIFAGCVLGAVLFVWSATSLRQDLAVPDVGRTSVHAAAPVPSLRMLLPVVTFADLSRHVPHAPVRDVVRLAVQ